MEDTEHNNYQAGSRVPVWFKNLKNFQNRSWSSGIVQLVDTVLPYLLIMSFSVFTMVKEWPYWSTLIISVPAAFFLVRTFIIFHDCTHGSFFPSATANRITGFITGTLAFTPYEPWRIDHLQHHATNGQLDHRGFGDVYTMTFEEYESANRWTRLKYRVYRNPLVLFVLGPVYTFLLLNRVTGLSGGPKARRSAILSDLVIGLIVLGVSLSFGFRVYIGVQLPVILMAGSMGIWLFYIQHQFDPGYWKHDEKWNRYDAALFGASYYKLPAVLRWFTGSIGVHHLHHLTPGIPNYRLYKAYSALPDAQITRPLTFWNSLKSVRINLWSEVRESFISFREAHQLIRKSFRAPG